MPQQSPLAILVFVVGLVWYLALLGTGVAHIHRLGTGASAGVAILSGIASIVLIVLIIGVIGVAFAAMLVGMRGMGQ
jgi:hypothetical protein